MTGTVVLLPRHGILWAVTADRVEAIACTGRGSHLRIGDATLAGDGVPELARDLAVHRAGAVLENYWPYRCRGVAYLRGAPVVLLDADAVPPWLVEEEGARSDAR